MTVFYIFHSFLQKNFVTSLKVTNIATRCSEFICSKPWLYYWSWKNFFGKARVEKVIILFFVLNNSPTCLNPYTVYTMKESSHFWYNSSQTWNRKETFYHELIFSQTKVIIKDFFIYFILFFLFCFGLVLFYQILYTVKGSKNHIILPRLWITFCSLQNVG